MINRIRKRIRTGAEINKARVPFLVLLPRRYRRSPFQRRSWRKRASCDILLGGATREEGRAVRPLPLASIAVTPTVAGRAPARACSGATRGRAGRPAAARVGERLGRRAEHRAGAGLAISGAGLVAGGRGVGSRGDGCAAFGAGPASRGGSFAATDRPRIVLILRRLDRLDVAGGGGKKCPSPSPRRVAPAGRPPRPAPPPRPHHPD